MLDGKQRVIASASVSVRALDALRWVARGGANTARIGVTVADITLATAARPSQTILDARTLTQPFSISIELPGGLPPLRTPIQTIAGGRATFAFRGGL